jgi:hypothetical protein
MKFVISLLFSLSAVASPIHVYYEGSSLEAKMFKDIMINDYRIPEDLILLKRVYECEVIKAEGKLDICLKNNGDLILVSVDKRFINESLKVFQAP